MILPQRLIDPMQLANAAATIYTVPVNQKVVITKATCTGTTADARLVTFYIIKSGGGAATDTQCIVKTKTIPPAGQGDVELFELENHVLEAGDFIQGFADAATAVTFMLSGLAVAQ